MLGMGNLVDLPDVAFAGVSPTLAPVLLVDGPCAGRWEAVPGNVAQTWVRVGKPGGTGVETQMWAGYERALDASWLYTGMTVTTDQLYSALAAAREDGIEHGESYGV